ncbi:MAG: hypothetical protein CME63_14775 [Halobacteriovoraceae bacterium]|nr:hypothetical protein [Halobacteriovoraceae bacterium]
MVVTFFTLGFNHILIYAPAIAFLLSFIIYDGQQIKLNIKPRYLALLSLSVTYLGVCYFSEYYTFSEPYKPFIKIVVGLVLLTYSTISLTKKDNITLLIAYFIGVLLNVGAIMVFNIFIQRGGYGALRSVFTEGVENSPIFSNLIALCVAFFIPFAIFFKKKWIYLLTYSVLLLIYIYFGIFLKAKAFVIILGLALILFPLVFEAKAFNKKIYILIYLTIGSFFFLLIENTKIGHALIYRFENFSGTRIELLKDGFIKLKSYPLGGFSPNQSIVKLPWFHNIFLDTARLSGFFGLPLFLLIISFTLYSSPFPKKNFNKLPMWTWLFSFILMQQEVIIEGSHILLFIFLMSSFLMIIPEAVGEDRS